MAGKIILVGLLLLMAAVSARSEPAQNKPEMPESTMQRPKVIFLDVNETLLDLAPLKKSVGKALDGKEELLPLWFSTMLHYSLVETLSGTYHHFSEIGVAALMMVAESKGIELEREEAEEAIVPVLRSLPAHADVKEGLKSLKDQGFTLVSLTNSSNEGVKAQFENAGLIDLVDQRLTVEDTKKFKPHQEVYRWAMDKLGVDAGEAMMVAAHAWDIAGADAAGMRTVFVKRPGKVAYPLAKSPDHTVQDLKELAALMESQK
ncbi:haloacid dehalogenase type II [Haloferula chungangensis]|uniref:Haloacid dehalogenase type II n=1 Tax=Haloferula chungangensis TaxID=1048331 RepID=A0ABW2L8E4_9BACT